MRARTAIVLLLTSVATFLALPATANAGCPGAGQGAADLSADQAQDAIRCLINDARDRHDARKLRQRDRLEAAAQFHATDMAAHGFFSHSSPDGSSSLDRALAFGYLVPGGSGGVGEVIGEGDGGYGPGDVVHDWMASGPHRRDLLDREFRHVGVGVALVNGEVSYSVDFGFR